MSRFTPDANRYAEFIACLWVGPVPDDLVLHKWLYLRSEPRSMLLLWEGDDAAAAYIERAFGSFGSLETYEATTDATVGLAICFERDLEQFASFLREYQGTDEEMAAQLDLRRRGLEASSMEEAAAAGRAWQAERTSSA